MFVFVLNFGFGVCFAAAGSVVVADLDLVYRFLYLCFENRFACFADPYFDFFLFWSCC